MDTSQVLSIFLKGALGSRGRKSAKKAAKFLTGHSGFLTASTVLTAAGVAWGIYDHMKGESGGAAPPAPGTGTPVVPPPIPVATTDDRGLPFEVLRVIRLAVSAARADGTLSPEERALILRHARDAGIEHAVAQELDASRPLSEILGGVVEEQRKQDLYTLAFTIVRADESVSGAERIYLAQLAHQLGLDATVTARLEQEAAAKIDAQAS